MKWIWGQLLFSVPLNSVIEKHEKSIAEILSVATFLWRFTGHKRQAVSGPGEVWERSEGHSYVQRLIMKRGSQ
jgi:hypothetical protein